ncbi:MAG: restriction endonuclease subunit S, partial [Candidatus Electrothrix sp. ATG2]|nr:restriction endonuclease subunit S [Candidatus Electrothrix sp. ATG2]
MKLTQTPIGDLVTKCSKWNPKKDGTGEFDYIDLSSVDKNEKRIATIERYPCADAPSRAKQLVKTGDILVATVRPNLNGVALIEESQDGMTASTGYCVLRPIPEKLNSNFLFHWVKTRGFVQRMIDVATGANYPAVSDAKVKASKIPLPPLTEQKRIAKILDAADALRAKRREAIAQLDTLLQSTFIDIFGDPIAEGWKMTTVENVV